MKPLTLRLIEARQKSEEEVRNLLRLSGCVVCTKKSDDDIRTIVQVCLNNYASEFEREDNEKVGRADAAKADYYAKRAPRSKAR